VKTIDIFTLMFTAGVQAVMASGFLFLQGMNLPTKVKAIHSWAYAMLLGWGSMSLRWGYGVIPDFLSLVLSNALATLALGLILLGLRRFDGQAPHMSLILVLGILEVLCVSWFTLMDDNFEARILVFSVYALVGLSLSAKAAFVGRSMFRSLARPLIGWFLIAMLGAVLLQAISALFFGTNLERLDISSLLNLLTLGITNILILGLFFGFVMLANDCVRAELTSLANTDALTLGLNRRAFMEEAARALARERRQERLCALLMFDLDHFKQINDRFGHVQGDVVLKGFADRVRQRLRAGDVFGRYGGEEFLVLLPGADAGAGFVLAEQLRTRVAEFPFSMGEEKTALTVSVGLAVDNGEGGIPELIEAADWALYRAKHRGRNRVVVFDEQEAEAVGMPLADE
jgi:diguanylate cyclase (GGDEF)-like protein